MSLKRLRENRRLTQKQLADLCGIHDSLISLAENGHREIGSMSYAIVVRLARALRVSPATLCPVPDVAERRAS